MDKRRFFQALLGITTGALIGSAQGRALSSPKTGKPLKLQSSPLAGFNFYAGKEVWSHLQTGNALRLQREKDNRFDARAVAVYWQNHKLGYMPADENTAVVQLLDDGEEVQAFIEELREVADPWGRVRVGVWLRALSDS